MQQINIFSWEGLTVSVPDRTTKASIDLISNVSGYGKAGELVALIGPSGSGKTTLLNTLANRKMNHARVQGSVKANGEVISTNLFRKISSYVEQEDSLIGTLTVRETINFAAKLSMPSRTSRSERTERVQNLVYAFGLDRQKDQIIGTPVQKGISGGQKRRVSMASQLVTKPNVLFLDEPTSGLDSVASYEVISKLKQIAKDENMIVICSIHQPSTTTFNLFDRLLLLSQGKTIYSGCSQEHLYEYFQTLSRPFPMHANPAEHLLEMTNIDFKRNSDEEAAEASPEKQLLELQNSWEISKDSKDLMLFIGSQELGSAPSASTTKDTTSTTTSQGKRISVAGQTFVLLQRLFIKSYRDILVYYLRLAMYIGLAILMGTVWLRLSTSQENIQPLMNAIFFSGAFMSFMAVAYIPAYLEDFATYKKERANGLYGPAAFVVSNFIIGVPFIFLIAATFSIITYFLVNFQHGASHFFLYLMWLFLDLLAAESLVVLVSSVIPIFVAALAVTAFANGLWMCVNGFLVSQKVLNVFWYYTFYWINYQRYVFQGMMFNEFKGSVYDCAEGCKCMYQSALAEQCQIAGEGVLATLGYGPQRLGQWVGIMICITFGMRLITWAILKMRS